MDRLLTAEEIAEQLGVTPQWVWAQARAGLIPQRSPRPLPPLS